MMMNTISNIMGNIYYQKHISNMLTTSATTTNCISNNYELHHLSNPGGIRLQHGFHSGVVVVVDVQPGFYTKENSNLTIIIFGAT